MVPQAVKLVGEGPIPASGARNVLHRDQARLQQDLCHLADIGQRIGYSRGRKRRTVVAVDLEAVHASRQLPTVVRSLCPREQGSPSFGPGEGTGQLCKRPRD